MKVGSRCLLVLAALWVATVSTGSCTFPDYGFQDVVEADSGGRFSRPVLPKPGTGKTESGSGGARGGEGGQSDRERPRRTDEGEGGAPNGQQGGEGGSAGAPGEKPFEPVVCSELESLAPDCECFDYRDHAYLYCSTPRTWSNAKHQCSFHEMRLVAIEDIAENNFLHGKVLEITHGAFPYFWIGGQSAGDPVVWSWPNAVVFWEGQANGAPVDGRYSNWRGGNPDAGSEACAFMGQTGWEDGGCSDSRPYICESY